MKNDLILSIFPGIDLMGKGFEHQGFCVVKTGDINIDGSDIRNFNPVLGKFNGVIGGSPCQDFSKLNRIKGKYGHAMLKEYQRVVLEASPDWYLFENVVGVPEFDIPGFTTQRFTLDLAWFTSFSRLRVFQWGTKNGKLLNPVIGVRKNLSGTAVVGNDNRSFDSICDIQGVPKNIKFNFLSLSGKKQAVANAVPFQLSSYLAAIIKRDYYRIGATEIKVISKEERRCLCNCGRVVTGRAEYAGDACRKRAERSRKRVTA